MLAAQIQNLPPIQTPTPRRPPRKTGGGDWPESNLYDPLEWDYKNEFFDMTTATLTKHDIEILIHKILKLLDQ